MASILDKYGIKEVADVVFYTIGNDGEPGAPALYLDTLKVSTIEQTAEEAEARGGKGNSPLIIWDYGKEITVTLEDALFSAKSMAIMFGNGVATAESTGTVLKTIQFTGSVPPSSFAGPGGKNYDVPESGVSYFNASGSAIPSAGLSTIGATEPMFQTFNMTTTATTTIEISANSFPGTYYVTGDTFSRKESNGTDEFFQFIIPKAKMKSENTITLEAEGDPTVFNMSLRVLRPADGVMMKLVKYDIAES